MLFIIVLLASAEVSAKIPRKCQKPTEPSIRNCGENAYFELCSNPCPPQNCSTLWTRYKKCPETCCKPACRCNDGYLRDDVTGRCIKRDECLAPCGPKEHYVTGSTNCQKTCANYKVTCPESMCKPYTGCICNDGRVRVNDDGTGDCILPELCPPRQCPVNEHWNDCPSVCLKETCISKSPDFQCLLPAIPLPCKPRCICDDGYLRDEYGNCIPVNHCTIKSCPINEVWRCSSLCARDSCASRQPTFECSPGAPSSVCVPACECVSGYLRDDTGVCVPEDLCPEKSRCGINEIAVPNATVCPPQTCESIYTLYRCLENIEVKPGCDCRKGYLRNKLGTCVPSEYCPVGPPQECGPNQVYKECGSSCGTSCNDLNDPRQACTDQCVEGCFCNDGYYMDEEGNCVPPGECPLPECTGPNEVALECGSYCDVKTCDDQNRTDIVCPAVCVRGCFCFDGYVRNAYGVCVLPEDCPVEPVCLQENEEYQSCGSSCPDNCDNYLDTSRICTMQCVAGCNCKPGYVRRLEDKRCVLPEECPNKECTGLNEALNYCASYCPVTCANRFTQGDMACATVCRIGCDCIPGTLRNDTGVCVPTEECTPPVCRQNERYQNCGTACPLTCENINNPPQVCTDQCIEDCFCEEGYVRDRNWRCVKPSECEPICPPGEKYSPCSAHCQDTCDNYGDPNRICTRQCQSGCVCEAGTVRANNGQCVKPEQCKPTCPPGETFDECSAHCQDTCDNYKNPNRICTYQCQPGCVCNKGTVRGPNGECVKPDKCPQCPSNERWIECLLGFCSPKTCDEVGYPIACPDIAWPCAGGCICKENEVRNSQGVCIPDSECPSCGGDFNATKGCGINCGRLCSNYDKPNDCATLPLFCDFNGCDCKEGYVFDELTEKCILPCDCPKPCNGDIYAEWVECPNPCPKTCAKPNPGVCNKMCLKGGCQCRQGYILGPNGKCVKPENCPADLGCNGDKNAIVRTCPNPCQETCEQRGPRPCPAICLEIGCECKPGFVLSKKGKCIKPEECGITTIITKSSSSASNQQSASSNLASKSKTVSDGHSTITSSEKTSSASSQSSSSSHQSSSKKITRVTRSTDCIPPPDNNKDETEKCDEPCSDPNAIRKKCASAEQCRPTCTQPTPGVCPKICIVNGCECKPGFVLSKKGGKCIKPEECPQNSTCNGDPNALIRSNPRPCPSTCEIPNGQPGCKKLGPLIGCECKPGYLLSEDNGKCILPGDCKGGDPCGRNATFVPCKVNCPNNNCPVNDNRGVIACSMPYPCYGGCACKLNYRRVSSAEDRCILASECPPVKCTRQNEVWSPCPSACLRENCEDIDNQPTTCNTLVLNCQPQCICKKGHFRNDKGLCVPAKQCPTKPTCSALEVYDPCSAHCEPTCENHSPNRPCAAICLPGCKCIDGLVRRQDGRCVKLEECSSQQCKKNEVYTDCGTACPATCDNRGDTCTACTEQCVPGCFCSPGLVRAADGSCIKPKDCPPRTCSGPNEEFVECPPTCPPTDGCSNMWSKFNCTNAPKCCKPQCRCKENYLRNNKGICVTGDECTGQTSPCSDPNAERVECAPVASCRPTCANPNPGPCTLQCELNECVCKSGFVLSKKDGTCIRPEECPKDTSCNGDPNAEIVSNPRPCPSTCEIPNGLPGCKKLGPPVGCECKPGYLLSKENGKCIRPGDCKGGDPCGQNATYVACKVGCPTNNCPVNDDRGIIACDPPYPCYGGCSCKLNYRRLSYEEDRCILASECPPVTCTRPNEVWSPCPSACLRENCEDINDQPTTCNTLVLNCQPQCICKKGHFRDDKGICVPAKQCPNQQTCPPLEVFDPCSAHCEPTCENHGPNRVCTAICKPGCKCADGLVRRKDGKCVKLEECPSKQCKKNEVYTDCGTACPATCDNRGDTCTACTEQCVPGCFCSPGLVRAADGSCIKPKDCPPRTCSGPNEEFVECPPTCPPTDGCSNMWSKFNCTNAPKCCKPQCRCKSEYFRNDKGICVTGKECTEPEPTCPPLEVYDPCSAHCEPTCENHGPNRICTAICKPGCKCADGLVRRKDGKCVKLKECPSQQCKKNEVYTDCGTACPATCDNRGDTCTACTEQCVPVCFCSPGLVRAADGSCIKPKDCPPRTCSGQNEEFVECPPTCPPTDGCSNIWSKFNCTGAPDCCKPQCRCKSEYFRNDKGICVTSGECTGQTSPCSDPNAERVECAPVASCRPTCANPNPGPCTLQCELNECVCKSGYVLSKKDGTCIKPDQCPIQESCNGDQNAVIKECPLPCPATCKAPNAVPCRRACQPVGCQCKDGYILSESRKKCIRPDQCEGGNPCGRNETFVSCRVNCPSDNCPINDSPNTVNCETPSPCYPGCVCKINYRRRSATDRQCIYASECPPVKCTRQNEVWSPCPSACLAEDCSDVNAHPVVCNTLLLNCQPKCICKKNHFRNDDGLCVPANQCPNKPPIKCKKNEVYSKCKITCPPQLCSSPYTDYACPTNPKCVPGCDCISEYLRNGTVDDECIPSSQCPGPQPVCGSNEHYETNTNKCQITCENMGQESCMGACETTSACFCDDGYVRNKDGVCIKKKECLKKCATG